MGQEREHGRIGVDRPGPVRPGEALDETALRRWLAEALGTSPAALSIEQFPGGHSNLTYAVTVGARSFVLRRPPFGATVATAHDMGREYQNLSRLPDVYPKAPRAIAYCDDPAVLGAPFDLMERREGVIVRGPRWPEGLGGDAEKARAVTLALVDGLVELHGVDPKAAGLASLGRPAGYLRRQVEGWTRRYLAARTDTIPDVEAVGRWLADHLPAPGDATLIHNDYKLDNVLLDPDAPSRIRAVLDWEMATLGDPRMDLGTTLGYWVEASDPEAVRALPLSATASPGCLTRTEVVERYAQRSGRAIEDPVFYFAYGLFKICGIAQQIYRRYVDGHTKDPRFQGMIGAVQVLSALARRAIDTGRISALG
ncbi:MAG: phosphotransferase family protein [Deltaproteobacteria bacterium]|nr:MAG: phosphotransferase family protein [Deltaproteobacteria bacterium]